VHSLMSLFHTGAMRGSFTPRRGANALDGGAPWYGVYETSDGGHVSVGPIEPQFFAELCERLDVEPSLRDAQADRARWPALRAELARIFLTRSRDAWAALLEGSDACFAPVLALGEAPAHPHNVARGAFVEVDGTLHPAPAPRFSRTPSAIQGAASTRRWKVADALVRWAR
jgi:alpha-methylacyl-CoA racemase